MHDKGVCSAHRRQTRPSEVVRVCGYLSFSKAGVLRGCACIVITGWTHIRLPLGTPCERLCQMHVLRGFAGGSDCHSAGRYTGLGTMSRLPASISSQDYRKSHLSAAARHACSSAATIGASGAALPSHMRPPVPPPPGAESSDPIAMPALPLLPLSSSMSIGSRAAARRALPLAPPNASQAAGNKCRKLG